MEGALRLRKVAADFGDDLRQEDIKKLMFLRDIPQGIQERLTNAVEVFQHLEETAKLNFRDPQAIIDVMREMKKEKWALDTEKQFGIRQQQRDVITVVHRPEQESRRQEFEIILESDSQVVRREHSSTATKLSNSLKRRMKLHDEDQFSPIDELCCKRDSVCSTQQVSCSGHCQNTSNINDRIHETFACRTSSMFGHKKLTRNGSCASKRSSGYASGVSETDFYGEDNDEMSEDEEEYCRKNQHHFQTLSPINSRSSTLGSKTSSYDGYATANDDEDEGISESKELANIPLQHSPKDSKTFQDYIMYSPPYNGVQVLEGDMVVHVKELQKAVEKSTFGHCTQSIPFPSFSIDQGVQFQIQLYPVGLGNLSSPSCAVYLVVLGWSPDRRVPILPKFEININVSAIQQTSMSSKGKNVTIVNERTEVDVMKDILPPTPSNVDYTNIALFPTLVPHTELFQLESKSIVIKASLTYKPIVPCPS